jgi:hypothetical protein
LKKIIIFTVLLFTVFASTLVYTGLSINSFEGRVTEIIQNNQVVLVDCPIPQFGRNINDIAYLCSVLTNEETIISTTDGERLTLENLELGKPIKVVLSKRYFIGKSKSSREVTAKEIILLN